MITHTYIEEKVVGEKLSQPRLELDTIIRIIENSTVIDSLQRHIEPSWTKRFFTELYNLTNINEYWIKSFLICQYPLSVIELMLKDEERNRFRELKGLIVDFDTDQDTKEFEAYVRKLSENENLIVFNEQFFNFLFDYHLLEPEIINKQKNLNITELNNFIISSQENFYLEFQNNYDGFNINKFLEYPEQEYGNIYKFKLLSTLLFIFSHEMAHCYLGHTNRHIWEIYFYSTNNQKDLKETPFNKSQIDELDADMFASDICMNFIHQFSNLINDDIRITLMNSYISFLLHFANLEEKDHSERNTNPFATHPSSKYRVIYLMFRNKKFYEKLNMTSALELIEKFEKMKDDLVYYNYQKDFGVNKLLKY